MDLIELSRAVSHALRHEPWLYELELDDEGWVPVESLISAIRQEPRWALLSPANIAQMVQGASKARHELKDGRIRALYGHSVPKKLLKKIAIPPKRLYHGTSPEAAEKIMLDALRPMGRHYVHLSTDEATAIQVGLRKTRTPIVQHIRSREAHERGVRFYCGNDLVWLADVVPAQFIE